MYVNLSLVATLFARKLAYYDRQWVVVFCEVDLRSIRRYCSSRRREPGRIRSGRLPSSLPHEGKRRHDESLRNFGRISSGSCTLDEKHTCPGIIRDP